MVKQDQRKWKVACDEMIHTLLGVPRSYCSTSGGAISTPLRNMVVNKERAVDGKRKSQIKLRIES